MSSSANKKHLGERTSKQVAAPIADAPAPILEPGVLETYGTLPNPYVLPIAESASVQVSSRIPRFAATNQELGRKWGIPDADLLSDSGEERRMTRTRTKLACAGALPPTPDDLVYRGHDGIRIKNSRRGKQTKAEKPTSDSEPAALSAGAPVVQIALPGGEPAALRAGAPTGVLQPGGEPIALGIGAPVAGNLQPDSEPAAPRTGAPVGIIEQPLGEPAEPSAGAPREEDLPPEAENAARAISSRPGKTRPDGWTLAVAGTRERTPPPRVLSVATRFFPSWFDLSEQREEDPYGPLPREWLVSSPTSSHVLPTIKIDSSLATEFWSEIDSSDEERELQRAIQASVATAAEEFERREQEASVPAMAILVEMNSDKETEPPTPEVAREDSDSKVPEAPAGRNGRYSSEQKGKTVPRSKDQREFLRRYVSRPRGRREKDKSMPSSSRDTGKTPQGPAQFKREPSLVPEGGWFRASTAAGGRGPPQGPPSSSSSSESDSSSSDSSNDSEGSSPDSSLSASSSDHGHRRKSSNKKRHREKQKRETKRVRKALAGVKIKPPFSWNGTPDLDLFDQWTYEVDTWRELYGLSDKLSIKLVVQFLTGAAGKFFMKHVATCQSEWNMASLYEALFDYCFPTDYKAQLRLRLERAVQGKTKVRDFVREIQHLAARFPDVSDFQLAQIFWRGVHGHIRVYLIEKGLHPERTALNKMVKYAACREEAYLEARRDERAFEGQIPGRNWGRFTNRATGPAPFQPQREQRDPRARREKGDRRAQGQDGQSPSEHRRGDHKKGSQSKKLTKEERDKLRAEGRCFSCGEKGHESRNCDKRKTARAPNVGVGASSIRFADIERLAERARRADGINLAAVRIDLPRSYEEQPEEERTVAQPDDIWARAHTADCIEYLLTLLVSYFDPEEARDADLEPEERFTIRTNNGELTDFEFLIIDHLAPEESPDEFIVSRAQMDDQSWGIPDMLQEAWDEYASLPPRSEWGQGFPSRGVSDKRYPARFWLKSKLTAVFKQDFPSLFNKGYSVNVEPHAEGYALSLTAEEDDYLFIGHEEVRSPSFDARSILTAVVDDAGLDAIILQATRDSERRRRCMAVMVCRARVGAKPRKGKQVERSPNWIPAVERNAMKTKDFTRTLPKPIVVTTHVNEKPVRALIDTGSMADFLSTTLVDQLGLTKEILAKPLPVQLAVHGSRSKINCCVTVDFKYQEIDCKRRFDVVNLDNYDMILGTPFLFQHKVAIGLNPIRISIGTALPVDIHGEEIAVISSAAADLFEDELDQLREELRHGAADLCQDGARAELPPLRAVNHTIPIINEDKVYAWRPSKCPDAMRNLWHKKKKAYLDSGRWQMASGTNASPMLMIPKPPRDPNDGELRLRTVVDKRQQNANTHKLTAPLPDIDGILQNVVKHKYRSLIDGKDAYEQIRVVPEHVPRTLFTTPDGTMVSLVLQQGDINGPATYQAVMNHIFAPYIGVFMDVYLDDIVIYSDTIEDHMKHVRLVFDVLRREKFFLGADKMNFFASRLKILGHIIDEKGIAMDPHKVDSVVNWKVPTNKSLLSSFLGAVGFLAPDCEGIRIPMGILAPLTSTSKPWAWNETHQRAFEQVKEIVHKFRNNRRVALDYSEGASIINLVTDASLTGASGYISQGEDLETAKVVTFWSGKFNSAQQNYPVHEQELLAIVESLKRFRPLLYGASFRICTDHKALEFLMGQKNLSPRQSRWLDVLNEFKFTVHYIPGDSNIFADALSRIYSDEPLGIERASTEYVGEDGAGTPIMSRGLEVTRPVYTGAAAVIDFTPRRSARLAKHPKAPGAYNETRRRTPQPRVEEVEDSPGEGNREIISQGSQTSGTGPQGSYNQCYPEGAVNQERREDTTTRGTVVSTAGESGMELPGCMRGRYVEDPYFKKIFAAPDQFPHFKYVDGLLYKVMDDGAHLLCIPDILVGSRWLREVLLRHAHSILAHLGTRKTAEYLRGEVWWPEMVADTGAYCRTCGVCRTTKSATTRPLGLLKPMPVPWRPWQYIGIDFVGPLPASDSRHGSFDMICVIIDQLTSMVHLVPTVQTYGAAQIAEVVFEHVYKLHGLPERIISDRDTLFTSIFWRKLHELLGTELRLSSSYHPQTDGATERANRTMTQMLRQCVQPDQKDWVRRLPAIELAMNTARSETTGFSPFFMNYGQMPRSLVWSSESEYPGVQVFVERMKEAIMMAHDAIIGARAAQVVQANKHRREATFKMGDLVYLSTKNLNLPKGRARKLVPKFLGPFRINKVLVEGATYQLDLSKELKARGLANAFHASLLRPHFPNDDRRFPGRQFHQLPGFGEHPREWAVDRIMSHIGKGADADFEVQWSTGDITWVPYRDVKHLQVLTEYCEALGITNIRQLKDHAPTEFEATTSGTSDSPLRLDVNAITVTVRVAQGHNDGVGSDTKAFGGLQKDGGRERKKTNSPPPTLHSPSIELTALSSRMARGVNEYTADDGVRWENYAREFAAWVANPNRDRHTYPGNPPEGYYEVYQARQRFAPGPRDYAALIDSVFAAPQSNTNGGLVTLPPEAFAAVLNSRSGTESQLLQLLTEERGYNVRRGPRPYAPRGAYPGRGGF